MTSLKDRDRWERAKVSRPEVQNEARPEAEKEELVDEEERSGSNKERGSERKQLDSQGEGRHERNLHTLAVIVAKRCNL